MLVLILLQGECLYCLQNQSARIKHEQVLQQVMKPSQLFSLTWCLMTFPPKRSLWLYFHWKLQPREGIFTKNYFVEKRSLFKGWCPCQLTKCLQWQFVAQDLLSTAKSWTFQSFLTIIISFTSTLDGPQLWGLTMSWRLLLRSSIPFVQRQKSSGASRCSWRNVLQSMGISSSTPTSDG